MDFFMCVVGDSAGLLPRTNPPPPPPLPPPEPQHPVFGKVVSGMDVVNAINTCRTKDDNPVVPVQVISVTIA